MMVQETTVQETTEEGTTEEDTTQEESMAIWMKMPIWKVW